MDEKEMEQEVIQVRDILAEWLEDHGYDGLWCDVDPEGCGCTLDYLAPCGEDFSRCEAGYLQPSGGVGPSGTKMKEY